MEENNADVLEKSDKPVRDEKRTRIQIIRSGKITSAVLSASGHAFVVKNSKIKDGFVLESDLKTEYGLDFEDILKDVMPTAKDIENALHDNNVWTVEDYKMNAGLVMAALSSVQRSILVALNSFIKTQNL